MKLLLWLYVLFLKTFAKALSIIPSSVIGWFIPGLPLTRYHAVPTGKIHIILHVLVIILCVELSLWTDLLDFTTKALQKNLCRDYVDKQKNIYDLWIILHKNKADYVKATFLCTFFAYLHFCPYIRLSQTHINKYCICFAIRCGG